MEMTTDALTSTERVRRRRAIITQSLRTLEAWGCDEMEVPLLAPHDELRSAVGDRVASQLFRFVDRDGRLLFLRGDITPVVAWQFARVMRPNGGTARVSYANRIARVQRSFAGQQLESYVVGMELIGAGEIAADLECICMAADVLERLDVNDLEIHVGDIAVGASLIDAATTSSSARDALRDALRRRDAWRVRATSEQAGVAPDLASMLQRLCKMNPLRADVEALANHGPDAVRVASRRLLTLLDHLTALGLTQRVRPDLAALDDRGYYTGMRFRLLSHVLGEELGSGGRYDRLLGHFGPDRPAVGFGLRVDRLITLREARSCEDEAAFESVSVHDADVVDGLRRALAVRRRGAHVRLAHEAENRPTENHATEVK